MRNFAQVLADIRRGACVDELTDELKELLEACEETGRGGSLTLKLTIKPNGDGGAIVTDEIKSALPRQKKGDSFFFIGADCSLVRTDPRQRDFQELADAQRTPATPKEVKS